MWEELQLRSESGNRVTGGMTMDAIAARTSNTIISGSDDGALFDETSKAYQTLRERVEGMMKEVVVTALKDDLKPYYRM